MKKLFILLALLSSLMYIACSSDSEKEPEIVPEEPTPEEPNIDTTKYWVITFNIKNIPASDLSYPDQVDDYNKFCARVNAQVSIDSVDFGLGMGFVAAKPYITHDFFDRIFVTSKTYPQEFQNKIYTVKLKGHGVLTMIWTPTNCMYITSIDLGEYTNKIKELGISNSLLSSFDFREYTSLEDLSIGAYHQIEAPTNLDISKCQNMKSLQIFEYILTSLDISKNTALTELWCGGTELTSLDISKNTALTELDCSGNELTSLDVSKNTALTVLDCCDNQLTSLDVSKNTALRKLCCDDNQLTSLDVSKNTALVILWCYHNQLNAIALNKIFTDLPQGTTFEKEEKGYHHYEWRSFKQSTIKIGYNPGTATCDKSIVEKKDWIVKDY